MQYNKFILANIFLISLLFSCTLANDLGDELALLDSTTDTIDTLVSNASKDFEPEKLDSARQPDLLGSSTGSGEDDAKNGVAGSEDERLTQEQAELQQEIALRNELQEKLHTIDKDTSMDIGKVDKKIASLEALKKQLEDDLKQELSSQTNTSKAEQAELIGSDSIDTLDAQQQVAKENGEDTDSSSKTQPIPHVASSAQVVADSKKTAVIKEAIEAINTKIDVEKKRKAKYEAQEAKLKQELEEIKAEAQQYAALRQKIKEEQVRSQKFLRVTEDLTESAKKAQDKTYGIIDQLEKLDKGIKENKDSNKEALNKSLIGIIFDLTTLSKLIEAHKKIDERKSLGHSTDEQFDSKFANIKDIKDKLKWLCGRAKSHIGGNLSSVTVDGLQTDAVTKAISVVKLIQNINLYQ